MRILTILINSIAFFNNKQLKKNNINLYNNPHILSYDVKPIKQMNLSTMFQEFSFTNNEKQLPLIQEGKQNITKISFWTNKDENESIILHTKLSSLYSSSKTNKIVGNYMEMEHILNISNKEDFLYWNYSFQITKTGKTISNIDEIDNINISQNKLANLFIKMILRPIFNGQIKAPANQRHHLNLLLKNVSPRRPKLNQTKITKIQQKQIAKQKKLAKINVTKSNTP